MNNEFTYTNFLIHKIYGTTFQVQLTMVDKRIQQMSEKLGQTIEFTSRLVKYANPTEVMVFKQLLDTRLNFFLNYNADVRSLLLLISFKYLAGFKCISEFYGP